jgi:hypothetical protein
VISKIVLGRARPRRDVARRPALDGRAPRAFPTPLCPRPRATRSCASQRPSAQGASNRAVEAPYARRARGGPLVRPRRRPRSRGTAESPHRHPAVTLSRAYKRLSSSPPPPRHPESPSSPRRAIAAAAGELTTPLTLAADQTFLDLPRASRAAHCASPPRASPESA